jgi:uncharacterized repeat protein (TIGR01451 family)
VLIGGPALTLTKTGTLNDGGDGVANIGDTITYAFTVTNTGSFALTNITLSDPGATVSGGPIASLAPAASDSTTFTAIHTLTQADVNAGSFANTATVTGTPPSGPAISANGSETVNFQSISDLVTVKTRQSADATPGEGDTVAFRITVTNNGPARATNVSLTDQLPAGLTLVSAVPSKGSYASASGVWTIGALANGASATLDLNAAVDAGEAGNTLTNRTTAAAGDQTDPTNAGNDLRESITVESTAALTLVKVGTLDDGGDGIANVGDIITYAFTVTNTGNVTLTNITLSDPGAVISGGPIASLAPGASDTTTFIGSHVLTQADINAGSYANTALLSGTPPTGPPVTASGQETVALPAVPGLEVTKLVTSRAPPVLGSTVVFSIRVANTGNVRLTGVSVADTLTDMQGGALTLTSGPTFVSASKGSAEGTLKVGETATYRATFTITQAAIDGGGISNSVTGTGRPPSGPAISDVSDDGDDTDGNTTDDPTQVIVTANPALTVAKSGALDVGSDGIASVGDVISYTFTVANTGSVTLSDISLSDAGATVAGGPIASLAPGASDSTTFTATYRLTQADLTAGNHVNQATVTAAPPGGGTVTAEDQVTVDIPRVAGVAGTVFLDLNGDGIYNASDRDVGPGYIVQLVSSSGKIVRTAATDSNGAYAITASPGKGYKLVFRYPGGKVAGGIANLTLKAGVTLGNQDLPIDPSGVVYNSETRQPVAGVRVTITSASGVALPGACLIDASQQNQVTGSDGAYRFDLIAGADPACPAAQTEYRIAVSNPASYQAGFSTVLPPQPGTLDATTCPGDAIPGGPCQVSASTQPPAGAAVTYFIAILLQLGDPHVINNHLPVDPVGGGTGNFTKVAKLSQIHRGERVPYVITATDITAASAGIVDVMPAGFTYVKGSARANGVKVKPTIAGRTLTFSGLTPDNGTVSLELLLQATASAGPGKYVNTAQLTDGTGAVAGTASASVELVPDHVFDCGEIIGKVFDDKNRNSYQDEGEPGLPGVRVATVKGLLVITDKHGRFHVACADIPDEDIGSNFIMKLDPRTLPTGYRVTTENPRTVRLTRGKLTKLNFGAAGTRTVRLDIKDQVFVPGTGKLNANWSAGITKLIAVLEREPSTLQLVYHVGADGRVEAARRIDSLQKLIADRWSEHSGRYRLPIETRIVGER